MSAFSRISIAAIILLALNTTVYSQDLFIQIGGRGPADDYASIARLSEAEIQNSIQTNRELLEKLFREGTPILPDLVSRRLGMLGDPEMIQPLLGWITSSPVNSSRFTESHKALMRAARPETIPALASLMFKDEEFAYLPIGHGGAIVPKSFGLSGSILEILSRSHYFRVEVRDWAKKNRTSEPVSRLKMMRTWWEQNKDRFEHRDYSGVQVGTDLVAEESKLLAQKQERVGLHRRNLISKGLDPLDPIHWQSYPTLEELRNGTVAATQQSTTNASTRRLAFGCLVAGLAASLAFLALRKKAHRPKA